jgi:hypothetical protein
LAGDLYANKDIFTARLSPQRYLTTHRALLIDKPVLLTVCAPIRMLSLAVMVA